MIVGYARTSTVDQVAGFDAQIAQLRQAGCEKLFQEQVSSVGKREQLEATIDFVREGDVLVVTKLDRLARSISDLMATLNKLEVKTRSAYAYLTSVLIPTLLRESSCSRS